MTRSKSLKEGVTFIEVMLTVFMMGMLLSTAFVSQSTVLRQVGRWSRSLRATLALRELLIQAGQDRMVGANVPKEYKKNNLLMTYALERPKKESALSTLPDLRIQKARAAWGQEDERMVSLLYLPEKSSKKDGA